MDLANTFTLEEEIKEYIEDFNPDLIISDTSVKKLADSDSFPFLKYMYKGTSLKKVNKKWNEFIKKNRIYKGNNTYLFNLFEDIVVDVSISEKPTKDYVKLKHELYKDNLVLSKVIDVEFFEYYSRHKFIINSLNGKIQNKINGADLRLKKVMQQIYDHDFYDFLGYLSLFGDHDSDDLLNFLTDEFKVDDKKFTAFLDTEKIHLQFIKLKRGKKTETVLAYRGYGNHYPFTKNISGKKIYNKRFDRFDVLNQNYERKYYLTEFNKNGIEKNNFLLNWLDDCQQNYTGYFKNNFDYVERKNAYCKKNKEKLCPKSFDDLLKLNPLLRTRASALIAYHYFEKNHIF